ncbi:MAG: hypothetical protein ACTTJS_01710 [Wolinella sp.]
MKRGGFGLIYAIIILVIIATLLAFSMRFSSSTVGSTFDEHARIQLRLFERSVMEMAILELQKNPNFKTKDFTLNAEYKFTVVATRLDAERIFLLDVYGYVLPPQHNASTNSEDIASNKRISISSRKIVKP